MTAALNVNRRALLGGGAAAIAVGLTATATAATPMDRSEWEHAVRAYDRAMADCDRYYRKVWLPLSDKIDRIEDAAGLDRTRYGFWDRRKDFVKANPKLYHDLSAVGDESDRLGDAASDAGEVAMDTPAPDLAALRWKLEQLRDPDGDLGAWTASYVEQTFADIARLLPEGR